MEKEENNNKFEVKWFGWLNATAWRLKLFLFVASPSLRFVSFASSVTVPISTVLIIRIRATMASVLLFLCSTYISNDTCEFLP